MPSQRTKPKQIKWIMTCVCLNGHGELNTQYFYMGIMRFESQEYRFGGKMQVFVKLVKIRLFQARFVMTNVFTGNQSIRYWMIPRRNSKFWIEK